MYIDPSYLLLLRIPCSSYMLLLFYMKRLLISPVAGPVEMRLEIRPLPEFW
jgi:hypothetical protein